MRTELERRPLVIAVLGLILGLTLALHPIHLLFLLLAPWILRALSSRVVFVVSLAFGSILGPGQDQPFIDETFVSGNWVVSSMPAIWPDAQVCGVKQGDVTLELIYPGPITLCPGSVVRFSAVAKPPKEGSERFFRLQGLLGRVQVAAGHGLDVIEPGTWPQRIACSWRSQFLKFTAANLPAKDAEVIDSMWFHTSGLLDTQSRDEMLQSGSRHVLVSSGLQALLLAQGLLWILSSLPMPRSAQLLVVGCLLALYAIANGGSPAIFRMVVMFLIANSAYLVRREPDWLSALSASSILYLLADANKVYDPGFQLSSIAVLFIPMFAVPVKWKPGLEAGIYRAALRSIRGAIVAFVVLTPLLACFFGTVSLAMVPAGLLAIVAGVPVLMISMVAFPLSLFAPWAGGVLVKAALPLTGFVYSVLTAFGGSEVVANVPPFSPYWLVPFYLVLVMLWRPRVRQP